MKEIKNLTTKNNYFGEILSKSITQEMKDKALLILMFMVMKRNSKIKSREWTYRSYQRVYMDKIECSLSTLDFNSLKYSYTVVAKKERDIATIDLLGFFLQTEVNEDEEPFIIKLTGIVALLLVKSNKSK